MFQTVFEATGRKAVLQPLSSRITRLFAFNPEIMSLHTFLLYATSGTLSFAGMKRFLLAAVSQFLQKLPDRVDAHSKIRVSIISRQMISGCLLINAVMFLVSASESLFFPTKMRSGFITSCFFAPFQQTTDRTPVYRKAPCQIYYADTLVVCFQNQFLGFIVQHNIHFFDLCFITFLKSKG